MGWERARIVVVRPEGNPHAGAFMELAEALESGLRQLGSAAGVSVNGFEPGARHVVLGWHLLPEAEAAKLPEGTVLYNLEQLDDANAPLRARLAALSERFRIWDYSRRNIAILEASGFPAPVAWVPVGGCRELSRIEPAPVQDIDVLFYGSLNERRRAVLEGLQREGARVHHAFGVYGAERDLLVARARIVLNLHYYDASIFEMVRVSYLLANRKAVVAEANAGTEVDRDLAGAVVLAPYGELVRACMDLLRDPRRIEALEEAGFAWMAERPQAECLRPVLAADGFRPPSVSVVVLTRDRPGFLARALGSLRNQTFKDFEAIVVNDAGRDVAEVVAEARDAGLKVRLFTNPERRGRSRR